MLHASTLVFSARRVILRMCARCVARCPSDRTGILVQWHTRRSSTPAECCKDICSTISTVHLCQSARVARCKDGDVAYVDTGAAAGYVCMLHDGGLETRNVVSGRENARECCIFHTFVFLRLATAVPCSVAGLSYVCAPGFDASLTRCFLHALFPPRRQLLPSPVRVLVDGRTR
jgi:hypothetical protein